MTVFMGPDQMAAAGSYVAREYGDHGYSLAAASYHPHGGVVLDVTYADGSWFRIVADRWGNVHRLCDRQDHDGRRCPEPSIRSIRGEYLCDQHTAVYVNYEIAREATRRHEMRTQ